MPMRGQLLTRRRARALRRPLTRTEIILWGAIKGRRLNGLYWRVQHPFDPYILDFYCAEARMAVEIDGGSHVGRGAYDTRRDAWLAERGVYTLRLPSDLVGGDLRPVLDAIWGVAQGRIGRP